MKLNAKKMTLIILSMLAISYFDSVRGVFINTFVDTFNSNYRTMGLLIFMSSLAYMVGSLAGGQLAEKLGKALSVKIASFLMLSGIVTVAFSTQLWQLFVGFVVVGFANAAIALIINITIPNLEVKNRAWLMNFVHFIYGFGATIAVKSGGYLLEIGWTYRMIYLLVASLALAILVLSFFVSLPEEEKSVEEKRKFTSLEKKLLIYFAIVLGFYAVAEMQTTTWLISYLINSFAMTENDASSYLALFLLIFSFGRLVGGFFAHYIGYLKAVTLSMVIAVSLYTVGLILGLQGIYFIVVSGVFFSICYPTLILSLKDYFPNNLSSANGIVVFTASGINMLVSYLMGYIANDFGVAVAIWIIPSSLVLSLTMLILIQLRVIRF